MAPEKSTTPSSASSAIRDAAAPSLDLNLPDGEGFRSLPPCLSLERMVERNRQLRQWFPRGLRSAEERWQAKTSVAFEF